MYFVVPENIYTGPSHQRDLKYISEIRGGGGGVVGLQGKVGS